MIKMHPLVIVLGIFYFARSASGLPVITKQPGGTNNVSLGASITNRVTATTTNPPLSYQWKLNGIEITGATSNTLLLTHIAATNSGTYNVLVGDANGETVESSPVFVVVDASFTKITDDPVVNVSGITGAAWGDYDGDGFADLYLAGFNNSSSFLFRNNTDGTFSRITNGPVATDNGTSISAAWGDYDNDGFLDLIVSNYGGENEFLYRNNGNGTFTKILNDIVVKSGGNSAGACWADFDRDGNLDVFVANAEKDFLFRNSGNGSFTKITNGVIANNAGGAQGCAWADYDNDGYPDLFVGQIARGVNVLYHNERNGTFTKVASGKIATDGGQTQGIAWGDYDNDGYLDLFVANIGQKNFLYHNERNGTFSKITTGAIVNDVGQFYGCVWADFDNDGWLDLYVTASGSNGLLYHNNGDGTFAKIQAGSVTNEKSTGYSVMVTDYDNNGFSDIFVANNPGLNCFLYRNNGNSNNWLTVRCRGTVSNAAAIGAKVRVTANIGGRQISQLREISGGHGLAAQNALEAAFGLGDAGQAALVQIEWPSGIIQQITNVASKQIITIKEPSRISATGVKDQVVLGLKTSRNREAVVQSSPDLSLWQDSFSVTNLTGSVAITNDTSRERIFFRLMERP
jgi:hypothetical protein